MKLTLISPMKSVRLKAGRHSVFSTVPALTIPTLERPQMATDQDSIPAAALSKSCTICKQSKPLDAFSPNKNGRFGRQPYCRSCTTAKQKASRAANPQRVQAKAARQAARYAADATRRERKRLWSQRHNAKPEVRERTRLKHALWKAANPERRKAGEKKWQLKRRYGLTVEQFEAMRAAQGNCCAMCSKEFKRTPYVDHDHATGEVRGLLCNGCNMGLGRMESPGFLDACARYLEQHGRSRVKAV